MATETLQNIDQNFGVVTHFHSDYIDAKTFWILHVLLKQLFIFTFPGTFLSYSISISSPFSAALCVTLSTAVVTRNCVISPRSFLASLRFLLHRQVLGTLLFLLHPTAWPSKCWVSLSILTSLAVLRLAVSRGARPLYSSVTQKLHQNQGSCNYLDPSCNYFHPESSSVSNTYIYIHIYMLYIYIYISHGWGQGPPSYPSADDRRESGFWQLLKSTPLRRGPYADWEAENQGR